MGARARLAPTHSRPPPLHTPSPQALANDLADLLAPQSGAYYDVWLDGEKFYAHEMEVRVWVCGCGCGCGEGAFGRCARCVAGGGAAPATRPLGANPPPPSLPPDPPPALSPHAQNPKVTADRAHNAFGTNFEGSPEPIYGPLFLPRKFKIGVTGERSARAGVHACEREGAAVHVGRCRRGRSG